tara:strand:+ start:272 stop:607 length:336 start_codon:yes stop_codon:yes gene_type:complete
MNVNYDKQTLVEGNRIQKQAEERPSTFAEYNGASMSQPTSNLELSSQTRMAGEKGARAIELMNNPNAQYDVEQWMNSFGQSNQGAEFNQSKMQLASEADSLAETNQLLGKK